MSLQALRDSIVADGKVDDNEVRQLVEAIFGSNGENGQSVSLVEAALVQQIKDAVGNNAPPAFYALYGSAMVAAVTKDGSVDADEVTWLAENVKGDGEVDDVETVMLHAVRAAADWVDDSFNDLLA